MPESNDKIVEWLLDDPAETPNPIRENLSLEELLDRVEKFLERFVAYPSEATKVGHVLWIAHTHCMDVWESTPRIAFLSPEPASGKTRALEVTETMVPRPIEAINATPAYMFRKVPDPDGIPTILYDEIDTIFGPRAKDNEDIRGILNAGHRRGAVAGRCFTQGGKVATEELPAYCAVALAGIGNLPDTILTRSVVIRMRRRKPTEHVEPYRRRLHAPDGNALGECLAIWGKKFDLEGNYPEMPSGVGDRDADVWEPLIAIADAAGEKWSNRARVAAVALVALARDTARSLGVQLLTDLKKIFGDNSQLPTETILQKLCELEESPWGDLRGKPLDSRRLAYYLRAFDVKSKGIREGKSTPKGYTAEDLFDSWARYVPPPSDRSETSATNATASSDEGAYDDSERLRELEDEYQDMPRNQKGDIEEALI